ncbi:MAG: ureidoglycolate lyase [Chloroflexota bacterium]
MTPVTPTGQAVVMLTPLPLTADSFAEFGSVVGPDHLVLTSTEFPFFTNLATLQPVHLPITYINRHHDHQQLFSTLDGRPMIVVVAAPTVSAAELRPEHVRAFVTDGSTAIVFTSIPGTSSRGRAAQSRSAHLTSRPPITEFIRSASNWRRRSAACWRWNSPAVGTCQCRQGRGSRAAWVDGTIHSVQADLTEEDSRATDFNRGVQARGLDL